MPCCGSVSIFRRGQGIGFRQQALMHGIRPEALIDQAGRTISGVTRVSMSSSASRRAAFSESHSLRDAALRVGSAAATVCQHIQDDRIVSARDALAQAGRRRIRACRVLAAATPEFGFRSRSVMAGLCHGIRIMAI